MPKQIVAIHFSHKSYFLWRLETGVCFDADEIIQVLRNDVAWYQASVFLLLLLVVVVDDAACAAKEQ